MALIKCEECGQMISDTVENCPNCGAPVEKKLICPECGNRVNSGLTSCPKCGYKFNNKEHDFVSKETDNNNGQFSVDKSLSNRQVAWNCIRTLALLNKIICAILAVVWFGVSCAAAPRGFLIGIILIFLAYAIYLIGKAIIAFIAVALETSDDIREIKNYMEKSKKHGQ